MEIRIGVSYTHYFMRSVCIMQPLGTKVYLLKRYSPSDSFCTLFFWEFQINKCSVLWNYSPKNYTLKNAGLFQPKFGSNIHKPKCCVKMQLNEQKMTFLTQHLGLSIFYPNMGSNNPALFRVYYWYFVLFLLQNIVFLQWNRKLRFV